MTGRKIAPHNSPTEIQRRRTLEALRVGPKTTYDLRRLGIFQAPTRIFELRARGYPIQTVRVLVVDQDGFPHKGVALYSVADEKAASSWGEEA